MEYLIIWFIRSGQYVARFYKMNYFLSRENIDFVVVIWSGIPTPPWFVNKGVFLYEVPMSLSSRSSWMQHDVRCSLSQKNGEISKFVKLVIWFVLLAFSSSGHTTISLAHEKRRNLVLQEFHMIEYSIHSGIALERIHNTKARLEDNDSFLFVLPKDFILDDVTWR